MHDDVLHTRVGAVVLLVLGGLVAAVIGLEGKHLQPGIRIHVRLGVLGPMQVKAPVRISGRTIGEVEAVRLVPDPTASRVGADGSHANVILDVWIAKRHRWLVHRNSEFFVNQQSVFGEAYLEVGPPRQDPGPLVEDDTVVDGIDPPELDRIAQKTYQNLLAAAAFAREGVPEARDLGRALAELGRAAGAAQPEPGAFRAGWAAQKRLYHEVVALLSMFAAGGLTTAVLDRRTEDTRAFLARARRDLAAVHGRLEPLGRNVDFLRTRLASADLARFTTLVDDAKRLVARIDALLGETQAILALVDRGEGTLGALLHDTEIADEFKETMRLMKQKPWVTVGHP